MTETKTSIIWQEEGINRGIEAEWEDDVSKDKEYRLDTDKKEETLEQTQITKNYF